MMGYALICTGDLSGAERKLTQARQDATALERPRIARFARFNLAVVDELRGEFDKAERALDELRAESRKEMPELARWSALRLAWLAFRRGAHGVATDRLDRAFPGEIPATQRESVQLLRALIAAVTGHSGDARRTLEELARTYRERGDLLTPFALDLWRAHFEHVAGRPRAAERAVAEALGVARARGFRLAPNWWAPELAAVARRCARGEDSEHALRLISPSGPTLSAASQDVSITSDGDVLVDGRSLDGAQWRVGRAGSGVLRRYFNALAAAHPAGLSRDELADLLWPESEGDKAVRNLYAATDDLRRVLAGVPGLALTVTDQRYRLHAGDHVRFE